MAHDFQGDKYRIASAHQQEWGQRLIASLCLRGDEQILDLGCGDGRLTAMLAAIVPQGKVTGIDASPGMLAAAQQIECSNLTFRLQDIEQISFRQEFDVIVSNAALHWVSDHHALLANVYQALKPGGIVRFNFAGNGNCRTLISMLQEVIALPQYRRYFADFTWPWYMPSVKNYRQLAIASPFCDLRVWEENADRYFPDTDTMIGWIDQPSLVPFLPRVPEVDRSAFREMVVERMIVATQQADGQYFETFRRVNLSARKESC